MSYVIDQPIYSGFILRDGAEAAITGLVAGDFAVLEAYLLSSPSTTAAVTLAETGDGEYVLSFTPSTIGIWFLHAHYTVGGTDREFDDDFLVEAAGESFTSVTAAISSDLTLVDIRLAVGSRIRDAIVLTATAAGSTSTFVDTTQLLDADDAYISTWGVVISGTVANVGHVFRVIDSSQTMGSITVQPAFPSAPAADDVVHLFNLMGKGFRPQYYDLEIAELVAEAYPDFMVMVTADVTDAFDDTTARIDVPAAMAWVFDVQYERRDGEWVSLPPKNWVADLARNQVRVRGETMIGRLSGETLRLAGYGRHPVVADDDDVIAVDREWIVVACAARLAARRTTSREWLQTADRWQAKADEIRGERATVLPNNAQRVR